LVREAGTLREVTAAMRLVVPMLDIFIDGAFGIGGGGRSAWGALMRVPEVIRAIATDNGTGR
jgi:hypothetical protein